MKLLRLLVFITLVPACAERELPAPERQNVRPAKLMTVQAKAAARRYEFSGKIEALQSVDVSFEVGGPLAELRVREGETIAEGALIAALDPTSFELAAKEAEVELKLAIQDLERKRRVLAEGAIARSVVEDAESHYELQLVRLNQASERLADTRIRAPFEGYVSQRYQDKFVNVRAGEPIVRLHDLEQLLVVVSVPEALLATASADQVAAAWAAFSFAPGQTFPIDYHENRGEADSLVQTYEVSFTMPSPEGYNVLPGMTAAVTVQLHTSEASVMLLPASALVPTAEGGLAVWVYDEASSFVQRRLVETGSPEQAGVPVTAGLRPGERVVVAGASQLQAGMRVRPLND